MTAQEAELLYPVFVTEAGLPKYFKLHNFSDPQERRHIIEIIAVCWSYITAFFFANSGL